MPSGPREIYSHNGIHETVQAAGASKPRKVASYPELVEWVGKIAYHNNGRFLLFRGQNFDYLTAHAKPRSRLAAPIYRPPDGGRIIPRELKDRRLKALSEAKAEFIGLVQQNPAFSREYKKWRFLHYDELSWAVFQHYGTLPTPLLDLTQSLHCACSIPLCGDTVPKSVTVYVLGFEETTPNIGYFYRGNYLLMRLMGVMPDFAKRPLYQEGYLAGSFPRSAVFGENEEFNFADLLLGKFEFDPKGFWPRGFPPLSKDMLLPKEDPLEKLLKPVKKKYLGLW
jgi:hypothetical protein